MFAVLIHKDNPGADTRLYREQAQEMKDALGEAWAPYATFIDTYLSASEDGVGFCLFRLDQGKEKFLEGCRANVPEFPSDCVKFLETV